MTKTERCLTAKEYHDNGYDCAQCILAVFREEMGLTEEQCHGSGLRHGPGHALRQHLRCHQRRDSGAGHAFPVQTRGGIDGKKRVTRQVREYINRFRELFVDLNCPDLLKSENIHGTSMVQELGVTRHCGILVVSAVDILCDYISELRGE